MKEVLLLAKKNTSRVEEEWGIAKKSLLSLEKCPHELLEQKNVTAVSTPALSHNSISKYTAVLSGPTSKWSCCCCCLLALLLYSNIGRWHSFTHPKSHSTKHNSGSAPEHSTSISATKEENAIPNKRNQGANLCDYSLLISLKQKQNHPWTKKNKKKRVPFSGTEKKRATHATKENLSRAMLISLTGEGVACEYMYMSISS